MPASATATAPAVCDIVTIAAQPVALVSADVSFADIPDTQRSASARVGAATRAQKVATGETFTRFAMLPGGRMRYEPGIIVKGGTFRSEGDVVATSLPAGRAAHFVLRGSFEGLPEAWPTLFNWATEQKLALAGVNWEVYRPNDDMAKQETHLYTLLA